MDEELNAQREAAIAELQTALSELSSGAELTALTGGHGLQSRAFVFSWTEPALQIRIELPYARVLSDEAEQQEDNAQIGAGIRLALLLLDAAGRGKLLQSGESLLAVTIDADAAEYRIIGTEGDLVDAGDDLEVLLARLELALPSDEAPQVMLWP